MLKTLNSDFLDGEDTLNSQIVLVVIVQSLYDDLHQADY